MTDKKTKLHLSGFEVVTPRGVQQWAGDSAGSASRAPGAFGSVLGDVGDDHVRMFQDMEEKARAMHASPADHRDTNHLDGDQVECIPQRIAHNIPSTFNFSQALLWISTSIGGHLSREHLKREVERWWSYNPRSEPPPALVSNRLRYAHLDPLSVDQRPILSAEAAFKKAGDQLLDALRGGRVKMWGEPSDPRNNAEFLSPYQCEQINFSEGQYGAARAVTASKPERFWTCLRFTSSEITDLWPAPDATMIENRLEELDAAACEFEVATEAINSDKVEEIATTPPISLNDTAGEAVEQIAPSEPVEGAVPPAIDHRLEHIEATAKILAPGFVRRRQKAKEFPFRDEMAKRLGFPLCPEEVDVAWAAYPHGGKPGKRPQKPSS